MKRLTLLVCLISLSSAACIKFYRPGEKNGPGATEAAEAKQEPAVPDFKKEQAKLDEARKHLEAETWADAERVALEVRGILRERDDGKPPPGPPRCVAYRDNKCIRDTKEYPWQSWFYASTAVAGLARKATTDELAGLFLFEQEGLVPEKCPADYRGLCDEMEAIAQKEDHAALFQRVAQGPVSGQAKRVSTGRVSSNYYYVSVPGMAGYSEASVRLVRVAHKGEKLQ